MAGGGDAVNQADNDDDSDAEHQNDTPAKKQSRAQKRRVGIIPDFFHTLRHDDLTCESYPG